MSVKPGRARRVWAALLLLLLLVLLLVAAVDEARSSRWQSHWLSRLSQAVGHEVKPGRSDAIRFPEDGPFDQRHGYTQLPAWTERLQGEGFAVTAQSRMSPELLSLIDRGLFAPFHEKSQVGLDLRDCRGETLFSARYPQRVYAGFDAVPPLLVSALLFIEDRELFDEPETRNPAIDWTRLGSALIDRAHHQIDPSVSSPGGSTLATQLEKYRHAPGGRTEAPRDKLLQMASASVRSYLDGPDTRPRRRQVVVDYLNTVPLAARAGFGEVHGLGDALWAWYGLDFDQFNRLLQPPAGQAVPLAEQALALKQGLSLLVAQRRPAHYLSAAGAQALRTLTDAHLRLLAGAGLVTPALRDAALPLALPLRHQRFADEAGASFADRKAATALRHRLLGQLALTGLYDLDRIDLQADSSYSAAAQRASAALLRSLAEPQAAREAGLFGSYLLREGDNTARLAFSFTLFERVGDSNLLRVQTDNLDRPFDLNEGSRLDLGSTAKLRTLVTYLEQVAALHKRWAGLDAARLAEIKTGPSDAIARWARAYLLLAFDRSLQAMLDAAMQRTYSASPAEAFYTGGGVHRFGNFESRDDRRTMTVSEALTRSVNLVFIRLMRDVVRHVMEGSEAIDRRVLEDADDPRRLPLLQQFADEEGSVFLNRSYRQYGALSPQAATDALLEEVRHAPVPLAAAFYALQPDADEAALARFLAQRLPGAQDDAASLHARHGPQRWGLNDRAYLAGVHPLALWLVGYLRQHPGASLAEVLAASTAQRQEAYAWLFKTSRKSAQDRRIRDQFEQLAFELIQQSWARLGYPFQALTPSYATALGASGDRPSALAELMGIIANGGRQLPVTRLQSLVFARDTPYETRLQRAPAAPRQLLDPAVAATVRQALISVVEDGTGRRLRGALQQADGSDIPIGGKTGTGDHRFDIHGPGGSLISSRVVNRSATLVFLIGDRFYGTLMAYVHEPYAKDFRFTSALPAQLLKALAPAIQPLIDREACPSAAPPRAARTAQPPGG